MVRVGGALAMGLNKAICRVSSSTCHLLSGCLSGLGRCFHGRRNTRRVVGSVRVHVTRLFTRGMTTKGRIVAIRSIRRIVTHMNGPRSFKVARSSTRSGGQARRSSSTDRACAQATNSHHLFHSPSDGLLKNMTTKLTTCLN